MKIYLGRLAFGILLCVFTSVNAQSNEKKQYVSFKTSFKDELNSQNNFVEETEFNIVLEIQDGEILKKITILDPRIPQSPLVYKIVSLDGIASLIKGDIKIYHAEDLRSNEFETITFYPDDDKNLNLMVSNKKSSQMFFDLKSVK